jgi:hypothetical protein
VGGDQTQSMQVNESATLSDNIGFDCSKDLDITSIIET